MKKIIVPIDFSELSMSGLKLALIYANAFKSDIQLVNVLSNNTRYAITEKKEREIAEKNFKKIIDEFSGELHKDGKMSYIIKKGRVYNEVAEQAEAYEDSIVICSTHGSSGWSDIWIGSNTYRIVESTVRPVLSISTSSYQKTPETIVIPIDVTKETREKVPHIAKIAKKFNSKVHILKVTTSTNEGIHNTLKMYASQVAKYFEERNIEYERRLIVGDNISTITIDYAKTIEADLIGIMTEQPKSMKNLLLGSYAQQMLNNSPVPVLSITPYDLTIRGSSFRTTGG